MRSFQYGEQTTQYHFLRKEKARDIVVPGIRPSLRSFSHFGGKRKDPVAPVAGLHPCLFALAGLTLGEDVTVFPPVLLGVGGAGALP
jgi:hypothetical protein